MFNPVEWNAMQSLLGIGILGIMVFILTQTFNPALDIAAAKINKILHHDEDDTYSPDIGD